MTEETLRAALVDAIKSRALFYYAFYKEFSAEIGPEETTRIMKNAIHKRGWELGARFRQFAPNDFEGLKKAFLEGVPDPEATFNPELHRCDQAGFDITLRTCPLKDAWLDAGLSDDEVAAMTDIAGQVDKGMFEGAGFSFETDTWRPGRAGCCHLRVRPVTSDKAA